jgi:hypothetical protein
MPSTDVLQRTLREDAVASLRAVRRVAQLASR